MSTAAVMKGIVEHEKLIRRGSVGSASDGGTRTPVQGDANANGNGNATTSSLLNAATESSSLLRGPAIVEEHPDGEGASVNGTEEDGGSTYGAVQTGSPPRY